MEKILKIKNCETLDEKEKALNEIQKICNNCAACELHRTRTKLVFSDGKANSPIMLIGEAPGADEDATGTPFVGRAGKLLNQFLEEAGFSRQKDIYICNTIKCRPPQNRVPSNTEKSACRAYLEGQIAIVKPKIILLCGSTAAKSFIDEDFKISKIRGQWIKLFGEIDAMPIFHPSYLLRNHSLEEGSPRRLMKNDLLNVKRKLEELTK